MKKTQYDKPLNLIEHFEEQVRKYPHNTAVKFNGTSISYLALNQSANRLARYITKKLNQSAKENHENLMIPICLDQSIDRVIGILAILKAGHAYVPIDPSYPDNRIKFILEDVQTELVLAEDKYIQTIDIFMKGACFEFISIEANASLIASEDDSNLESSTSQESLACVMYTSGSTGVPKGVLIPQRGITRLVIDTNYINIEPQHIFSQIGNIAFDASLFEIWGALLNGASVVLFDKQEVLDQHILVDKIIDEKVSHTFLTTALFNQVVQLRMDDLFHLKYLLFGGEQYHPEVISKISPLISANSGMKLIQVYGPTENTTFSTTFEITRAYDINETLPIGKAIKHSFCFVLDSNMRELAIGEIGEMYVGGTGLALGYLNKPELTDETFINNHFNPAEASKIYRTGDLVSLRPDGNFDFVDRIDGQVKVRGHRIELGEIECTLRRHPEVQDAVILLKPDKQTKKLVAYLILEDKENIPSVIELRNFLSKDLPQYMLPTHYYFIDSIPLNHNGKIDKATLLTIEHQAKLVDSTFVAPKTTTEEKIANIYASVLKEDLNSISLYYDFFELGGDSLSAARVIMDINAHFCVNLTLEDFLKNSKISKVAQKVDQSPKRLIPAIKAQGKTSNIPLSLSQEQIWLHEQLVDTVPLYNETISFTIREQLDHAIIEQSLNEIVKRHQVLRLRITVVNGVPHQNFHPFESMYLPYYDLSSLQPQAQDIELRQIVTEQVQKNFKLESEAPLRWMLFQLEKNCFKLFIVMHHICVDGVSLSQVFKPELESLYRSFVKGKPSPLPELPYQYSDYILWQRQQENENIRLEQLEYWKRTLADLPVLDMPTDFPKTSKTQHQGARHCFSLSPETSVGLKEFCRHEGTTPFTTLLTSFFILLHIYTKQEDLVVGTVVAGRNQPGLNQLIGDFLNTIILRAKVSEDLSFLQMLHQLRDTILEAFSHQDCPLQKVTKALNLAHKKAQGSPFQIAFTLEPMAQDNDNGWEMSQTDIYNGTAKFDLFWGFEEQKDRFIGWVDYNTELFKEGRIKLMVSQFQNLLKTAILTPVQALQQFQVSTDLGLSEDEAAKILVEWNKTDAPFPKDLCVHQLVENMAETYPDTVAVVFKDQTCSYQELNSKANQLAAFLSKSAINTEDLVCIGLERSIDMVIAMLGVMKAGGAYVPIDPSYPAERIAHILEDSQAKMLLTQESLRHKFHRKGLNSYCLDSHWETITHESPQNHKRSIHSKNLIYVIYTSGSTGKPKGTLIEHEGFVNLIFTHQRVFGESHGDRFTQVSSPGFDAAAFEIWPCLSSGSTLYIVEDEIRQDPKALQHSLIRNDISFSFQSTQIGELLISYSWPDKVALKALRVAGDRLNHFPRRDLPFHLYNLYGPTEACVWATTALVSERPSEEAVPHIGRPIDNTKIYILDSNLQPTPVGISGELYIGGLGVGRGYLNKAQLTAEKFIASPFVESDTLYKTGDIASFLPDGNINFIGRTDFQVKIRGFRIELGEIENTLRQHPKIKDVCVWVDQTGQTKKLVAFLIPQEKKNYPTADELSHFIGQQLPDYMIPSRFNAVHHFPLTANGKIDKANLLKFEKQQAYGLGNESNPVNLEVLSLSKEQSNHVDAQSELEKKLALIWSKLLGITSISIHDNFFMLGGDSILSIQAVSAAEQQGIDFTPRQLSQFPTISELTRVVTQREVDDTLQAEPRVSGSVALTPIQHWFFEQNFDEPNHWNQYVLVESMELLDLDRMQQSLKYVLSHHDSFSLRFGQKEQLWEQTYAELEQDNSLEIVELVPCRPDEIFTELKLAAKKLNQELNIEHGPIFRTAVFQNASASTHYLYLGAHHLAVDGVSWRILLNDIETIYHLLKTKKTVTLPRKTMSYQEWSWQLKQYANSVGLKKQMAYWRELIDAPQSPLPIDFELGPNHTASEQTIRVCLGEEETKALLDTVSKNYHLSVNDILLAIFQQTICQWTQKDTLWLWLEGHGREMLAEELNTSRTVGWFTSLFPVFLSLKGASDPLEILHIVKKQLQALPHKGISYGILRYLTEDRSIQELLKHLPEPQIGFNYLGQWDSEANQNPLFKFSDHSLDKSIGGTNHRHALLDVNSLLSNKQVSFIWSYSANFHKKETIKALARSYIKNLNTMIQGCHSHSTQTLSSLESDSLYQKYPVLDKTSPIIQKLFAHARELRDAHLQSQVMSLNDELMAYAQGSVNDVNSDKRESRFRKSKISARDLTEQKLANIWGRLFPSREISVTDKFFELGGSPYQAFKMLVDIENEFGEKPTLSHIDQDTSIEALATILRAEGEALSPIITLQKEGSKAPFFCVHPAGGSAYSYRELSQLLGKDQPFYGLESVYGYLGFTIETMAAKYLKGLREIQPTGPYFLGGWSFGGNVAFEMAYQLKEQGDEIALLAMIDCRPVSNPKQLDYLQFLIKDDASILSLLGRYFQNRFGNDFLLSYEILKPLSKEEKFSHFKAELKKHKVLGMADVEVVTKNFVQSFQCCSDMLRMHVDKPLDIQEFHYFRASEVSKYHENFPALEEDRNSTQDLTYGWSELSLNPIQIHEISGTHETIVFKPHVQGVADSLKLAIEESLNK